MILPLDFLVSNSRSKRKLKERRIVQLYNRCGIILITPYTHIPFFFKSRVLFSSLVCAQSSSNVSIHTDRVHLNGHDSGLVRPNLTLKTSLKERRLLKCYKEFRNLVPIQHGIILIKFLKLFLSYSLREYVYIYIYKIEQVNILCLLY